MGLNIFLVIRVYTGITSWKLNLKQDFEDVCPKLLISILNVQTTPATVIKLGSEVEILDGTGIPG